jgi:hypothetical protein
MRLLTLRERGGRLRRPITAANGHRPPCIPMRKRQNKRIDELRLSDSQDVVYETVIP